MGKCVELQPDGHYKDFGEVLSKLVEIIGMYNDCSTRHNGLVEYENKKVN